MGTQIDARAEDFELMTVLGKPALFTLGRVDRRAMPVGMHVYEVRHDDGGEGLFMELAKRVTVNHWGTIITSEPIRLFRPQGETRPNRILQEKDWGFEGVTMRLEEYREKFPSKHKPPLGHEWER